MKTCSYCHRFCDDNSAFCPNCAAQLPAGQQYGYVQQPYRQPEPQINFEGENAAITAFVLGIIALVLCYTPILSIASIICGAIAIKKSAPGLLTRKRVFANLGKIFGIIGLSVGIFFTVFWVIYFFIIIMMIMTFSYGIFVL